MTPLKDLETDWLLSVGGDIYPWVMFNRMYPLWVEMAVLKREYPQEVT